MDVRCLWWTAPPRCKACLTPDVEVHVRNTDKRASGTSSLDFKGCDTIVPAQPKDPRMELEVETKVDESILATGTVVPGTNPRDVGHEMVSTKAVVRALVDGTCFDATALAHSYTNSTHR